MVGVAPNVRSRLRERIGVGPARRSSPHWRHRGGIGWIRTNCHPVNNRPLDLMSFDPMPVRPPAAVARPRLRTAVVGRLANRSTRARSRQDIPAATARPECTCGISTSPRKGRPDRSGARVPSRVNNDPAGCEQVTGLGPVTPARHAGVSPQHFTCLAVSFAGRPGWWIVVGANAAFDDPRVPLPGIEPEPLAVQASAQTDYARVGFMLRLSEIRRIPSLQLSSRDPESCRTEKDKGRAVARAALRERRRCAVTAKSSRVPRYRRTARSCAPIRGGCMDASSSSVVAPETRCRG